jgi:hypothetical protein
VLAITLGIFIIVPPFVSIYNTCKRLAAAERLTGTPQGMEPGLLFILWIFLSPVAEYILQSNMNKVLQTQAGGAGAIAPGEAAAPPPQAAAPAEQPAPPPPGQPQV